MKRTLILTLCVLAAALLVCFGAMATLNATVDEARRLGSLAVLAEQKGADDAADSQLVALAQLWHDRALAMEMLASHDALHDVEASLAEARICLACGDHDDFLRTMSTLDMALGHIRDEEALRWENLY